MHLPTLYNPLTPFHKPAAHNLLQRVQQHLTWPQPRRGGQERQGRMLRGWMETEADCDTPREQYLKAGEPAASSSLFLSSVASSLRQLGPLLNTGISLISVLPKRFGRERLLHAESSITTLSLTESLLELSPPHAALNELVPSPLMRSGDFHWIIVPFFARHVCFSNFCNARVLLHLL